MTGASAIALALESAGIKTLFGMPGTHNTALFDLLDRKKTFRLVTVRNEAFAPMMADAYFRVSGQPAGVLTIPGPGASATVIGLEEAWGSSIPLLQVSIATDPRLERQGALHELPGLLALLQSVTVETFYLWPPANTHQLLNQALRRLKSLRQRPGPVGLLVPTPLLSQEVNFHPLKDEEVPLKGEKEKIEQAVDLLSRSEKPVIWAGGGVHTQGAWLELESLAEYLQAPVFTSVKGKGAYPEDRPLGMGNLGGEPALRTLMEQADLMLAVGTRFGQRSTDNWSLPIPKTLLQIDQDPFAIGRNYPVTLGIPLEAKSVLRSIFEQIKERIPPAKVCWAGDLAQLKTTLYQTLQKDHPEEMGYLMALRQALPPEGILVCDSTLLAYWARRYFPVLQPRTFLWPMGSGTIGWALPASLGASLGAPGRPVVVLCGDGGLMFSLSELATLVQEEVPVVLLVFNDNKYGMIAYFQRRRYDREVGVSLRNPELRNLSQAFGLSYSLASTPSAMEAAIREALLLGKPAMIEVRASLKPPIRLE